MPRRRVDLVEQLRRGDGAAVAHASAVVLRVVGAVRYGIARDARDDLVQQVLLELLGAMRRRSFDSDTDLEAFLRTRAHARSIDWLRRRRPTAPWHDGDWTTPPPQERAVRDGRRTGLLQRILAELPAPCRELLVLTFVRGLEDRAIAALQERSPAAVKMQRFRCIRRARSAGRRLRGGVVRAAADRDGSAAAVPRTEEVGR